VASDFVGCLQYRCWSVGNYQQFWCRLRGGGIVQHPRANWQRAQRAINQKELMQSLLDRLESMQSAYGKIGHIILVIVVI